VQRVHVPSYLTAVKSAPEQPFGVGHGLGTEDNPIFLGMHEASALVVGGSLLAAREIAEGRADRAVNIAGGLHHAMRDHAAGFCVYNDCAVAISWLLDHGFDRIAYVDVDVHHGDGVQAAFYTDPRVLTISLHQHPMTLWPGTGWPGEYGEGEAAGRAVNIPLPPGTPDASWLRAFHAVVPSLLAEFRPQILVTQCGVDTHVEDPLANLGLTVDGHRSIYRALRELATHTAGGKWLAVGGGGYGLFRVVPRSWTHLIATVLDRDVVPDRPLPAGWVAHTASLTGQQLPISMTDGGDTGYSPWTEGADRVDTAVLETRRAVFPLYGLDPDDPRD
jgi:acetoin utilization protein AcuC